MIKAFYDCLQTHRHLEKVIVKRYLDWYVLPRVFESLDSVIISVFFNDISILVGFLCIP